MCIVTNSSSHIDVSSQIFRCVGISRTFPRQSLTLSGFHSVGVSGPSQSIHKKSGKVFSLNKTKKIYLKLTRITHLLSFASLFYGFLINLDGFNSGWGSSGTWVPILARRLGPGWEHPPVPKTSVIKISTQVRAPVQGEGATEQPPARGWQYYARVNTRFFFFS